MGSNLIDIASKSIGGLLVDEVSDLLVAVLKSDDV